MKTSTRPTLINVGWLFRATAVLIFLTGAILHSVRLLIGVERLTSHYLTPPVDGFFGFLMLVCAVAGWLSFRHFTGSSLVRAGLIFCLVLMTVSVPIHLWSLVVWGTRHFESAPPWYSAAEIPMFLGLAYLVSRLRLREDNDALAHGSAR
jgi:uncharacterized membrane protein